MSKVKNWFLQNFWTGYSLGEKLFMAFAIATQIVVFCISRWNDHEDDTTAAVVSGIFWPVVAPITFALLFAKKYANENKRR